MTNRIQNMYNKMEKQIAQHIIDGLTTQERVETTRQGLDMNTEEHAKFQELKSLAVTNQTLTLAEGQTIYNSLGESVSVFNNQPAHVKSVLMKLFAELLKKRIAQ